MSIETNDGVYTGQAIIYSSTIKAEIAGGGLEKTMSMLTMFGKKSNSNTEAVSVGIPPELSVIISRQCPAWNAEALIDCTYARKKTSFKGCKSEVDVLDSASKVVVRGREFHSGEWLFWVP